MSTTTSTSKVNGSDIEQKAPKVSGVSKRQYGQNNTGDDEVCPNRQRSKRDDKNDIKGKNVQRPASVPNTVTNKSAAGMDAVEKSQAEAPGKTEKLPDPVQKDKSSEVADEKSGASSDQAVAQNKNPISNASGISGADNVEHKSVPARETTSAEALEVMPNEAPIKLPGTLEEFAIEINKRVENVCHGVLDQAIVIGQAFIDGMQQYHVKLKALAGQSKLAYNTVTQYKKIAECYKPLRQSWAPAQLPHSIDSLVRLTRLEPAQLQEALKEGKVKPNMGRKEVKQLLAEYRSKTRDKDEQSKGKRPASQKMDEMKKQIRRLKEAVEVCQKESPQAPKDMLKALQDHKKWIDSILGDLQAESGSQS